MTIARNSINFIQVEPDRNTHHAAEIIVETPVSLTVNGEIWLTFMCTPVDLEALAVGFLYNEGFIQSRTEIADVRLCPTGDNVDVWLTRTIEKPLNWRRTTGCTGGVTFVESKEAASEPVLPKPLNGFQILPSMVNELVAKLFTSQELYQKTGGVHTSALSNGKELIVVAEDVGRHNTLDKIAGRYLLENHQVARGILLTTGRISSEMLQKANRIGAKILISRTSPSSMSLELAEQAGITVIGYARRDRFRIYTHPGRIMLSVDNYPIPDHNVG